MTTPGEYLTIDEVAQMLRLSKMSVYRMVHLGELPARRFGRSFRITRDDLAAYLAKAEYIPPTTGGTQ